MFRVITPAGDILVATLDEAIEYRKLYGYPVVKIVEQNPSEGKWIDPAGGVHDEDDDEPWKMYE